MKAIWEKVFEYVSMLVHGIMSRKPYKGVKVVFISGRWSALVIAVAIVLSVVPCRALAETELLVSAAASLTEVFKEIGPRFAAANPAFASNSILSPQVRFSSRSPRGRRWTSSPRPTRRLWTGLKKAVSSNLAVG